MTTRIDLDNIGALARAPRRSAPPRGDRAARMAARSHRPMGCTWSAATRRRSRCYPAPVALLLALQPDAVLAIVKRLLDLEETALRAASLLEAGSDKSARREWARNIREHVERGAHAFRHGLPKAGAG